MWLDLKEKIHAPEVGRRWLNSAPLTIAELRGSAVLVDFWDYTCVNCIRTLPYVKAWDHRYRSLGLVTIGVHTPEFHFAHDFNNVERAVKDFGLEYPVVLDNEYQIWHAYSNRCWPAKYLIDEHGYVRFYQFGEGGYAETEDAIQTLLREIDPGVTLPLKMEPLRGTDQPGARCVPVTPELYLGFKRGRLGNTEGYVHNEVRDYDVGQALSPDIVWLDGPWYASEESVEACPLDGRPSRLIARCRGAELNVVMSPPGAGNDGPVVATVTLDGKSIPADEAGEDVEVRGKESFVKVSKPRMYRLVKSKSAKPRVLEISTSTPGLSAYALTFVSCADH